MLLLKQSKKKMTKKFLKFPEGFFWGASTASYQVEGGIYNNDWAYWAEKNKIPKAGQSTDHYNKYEEDFDLAEYLGHNAYRFSIEWSRIEPEEGKFDNFEIEHYKNVLIALKERGMTPFITLWHFTLPLWFAKKGGFENKNSVEIFARYCDFVTKHLGPYCKNWSTINEPMVYASSCYLRKHWPPFKMNPFIYLKVINNLIKAHNLAYKVIKKNDENFDVSLVKNNFYFTSDKRPWNLMIYWFTKWFWNHYFLQRTFFNLDSIGLNYYFHQQFGKNKKFLKNDMGWDLDPEGIYYVLKELKIYKKPIYVTEAGIADSFDKYRANYIKKLVYWIHGAIENKCDVRGYMYWSLLDNFEWAHGYVEDFGLIHVNDENKKRTIRPSAFEYKKICENNGLEIE
jgi:beta-glucosidase